MDAISATAVPAATNAEVSRDPPQPIFDTTGSDLASRRPSSVLASYRRRAEDVWLSFASAQIADRLAETLSAGQGPVWATLIGPFGFGKSATATAIWRRLETAGTLATPPISATGIDGLFQAVVGLLNTAAGDRRELVASAYAKAIGNKRSGALKRQPVDVMVEFLRLLCGPKGPFTQGVVVCIDEAQQLLGPLDPRALQALRSLVWGLRTERVNCAVLLTLDPLLYRRLDRWASDILHRIADRGEVLDLRTAYDAGFVSWLWQRWSERPGLTAARFLDGDLAIALGQYIEREDLANGPRTVVEVFRRVIEHPIGGYGLPQFVDDLKSGIFRFFSGSLNAQTLVNGILGDAWVNEFPERRQFVELLAGFPNGAPPTTLERLFPQGGMRERVRRELFAPLLVNASHGPALEVLQRVRRKTWELDQLVLRCWETLPALDSLIEHAPRLLASTLVEWWFGTHAEACGRWRKSTEGDLSEPFWDGEFDQDFPDRRIKIEVVDRQQLAPSGIDAHLLIRFLVSPWAPPECITTVPVDPSEPILLEVTLPLLAPIEELPPSIERYRKFLDPEPIRPIHLLAALADLKIHLAKSDIPQPLHQRADAFYRETCDFLGSTLLRGEFAAGRSAPLELEGTRLIRAHASQALHRRFPDYKPLRRIPRWREELTRYRRALSAPDMNPEIRMGVVPVEGVKADVLSRLEQRSVAAGDSLVRSLQGLIRVEGNKSSYRLWFETHDLENWALEQLTQQPLPNASLEDALRRYGCSIEEATEVISLLLARGAVEKDASGLLTPSDLTTPTDAPPSAATEPDAGFRQLDDQQDFDLIRKRLIHSVARLRVLETLEAPPSSSLSKHIEAHIRDTKKRIDSMIETGRNLRDQMEADDAGLPRGKLERRTAEVEETVQRITNNHQRTKDWVHAAVIFAGLERRAAHLRSPQSGALTTALIDLDQCTREWRERFATNSTEALHRSRDFLDEVLAIDHRLDEHLLDQRIAFDRRRRHLVRILGWAAPEPAPWGLEGEDPTPFDSLDHWTLSATSRAHERMKSAFRPGEWHDPQGTKVSFGELHKRMEPLLEGAKQDSSTIDELMSHVQRLKDGFIKEYQLERSYNDPASGPDFEQLARSFLSGEVEIIIRPRTTEDKA